MTSDWFSVYVETRAPAGAAAIFEDDRPDRLMALLEEHDGVVSTATSSWSATVSVRAQHAVQAVDRGGRLIEKMSVKAEMPMWPQVRAEAVRQDVLEQQNVQSTLPELVSAPEVAQILGVSPQRVHELVRSGRGFPLAVYELKVGKLWLRTAIEGYAEGRERRPGRPDKAALLHEKVSRALSDCGMTSPDVLVRLSDDRLVVMQITGKGLRSAQHWAPKIMSALCGSGLEVMPADGHAADDPETYLANGHPVLVVERPDDAAGIRRNAL